MAITSIFLLYFPFLSKKLMGNLVCFRISSIFAPAKTEERKFRRISNDL